MSKGSGALPPAFALSGTGLEIVEQSFLAAGLVQADLQAQAWDILWSLRLPSDIVAHGNLESGQRINHFPHTAFVQKDWLATQDFDFLPRAFSMPAQVDGFIQAYAQARDTLWVRKNATHRGVKLTSPHDVFHHTLNTETPFFVQEYVHSPHLIFGHKWDLGVFVAITRLDPLSVFVYDNVVFRLCPQPYPGVLDPQAVDTYVIGDNYLPPWEHEALESLRPAGGNSDDLLAAYFAKEGQGSDWRGDLRAQCHDAIYRLVAREADTMLGACGGYPDGQRHFFEIYRFDFVFDVSGNAHLLEVNLSPNLSAAANARLSALFQPLTADFLHLLGINERADYRARGFDPRQAASACRWRALPEPRSASRRNDAAQPAPGTHARHKSPEILDHGKTDPVLPVLSQTRTVELFGASIVIRIAKPPGFVLLEERLAAPQRTSQAGDLPPHYQVDAAYSLFRGAQLWQRNTALEPAIDALAIDLHDSLARHARDHVFLRAGVVSFKERTIVIPGGNSNGKSTLVLAFLAAGAAYGSDMYAVIDQSGQVHSYPAPVCIHGEAGVDQYLSAQLLGFPCMDGAQPVNMVLSARYEPDGNWQPHALSRTQASELLFSQAVGSPDLPTWARDCLDLALADCLVLEGVRGEAAEVVEYVRAHMEH